MERLTVLYDAQCSLCCQARGWLERQSQLVMLVFVPAGESLARRTFPGLDHESTLDELTVVGDGGEVYRGAKAWIMCLWALRKYRATAFRLRSQGALWAAKRFVETVSRNRRLFSRPGGGQ